MIAKGSSVPELLRGAWRRHWIRHRDGSTDSATVVVWLQLESLMADIRVPAEHVELRERSGLADCDRTDLLRLLKGESSSGHTTCTPIVTDKAGTRTAIAEWFCRAEQQPDGDGAAGGNGGVGFQPVTAYPEPGSIEWNQDGTVMTERAPSGAYVEEWHLVPGSREDLRHVIVDESTELYITGPTMIRVVDRPIQPSRTARLEDLAVEVDDEVLGDLVNCEFSLAEQNATTGRFLVTASTMPWLIGTEIGVQ